MDEMPMLPPQSVNSEVALIGAILIDSDQLERLTLDPADFYIERHQWIYEACRFLKSKGSAVDLVTVTAELQARKLLAEAGGQSVLFDAVNVCPSSHNAPSYAKIIADKALRRRIIQAAARLASGAYDESSDLQNVVSSVMERLAKSVVNDKGAKHISVYLSEVWDEINEALKHPQLIYGISSGFREIDDITFGFQKKETVKLAGEPGVGKSVLLNQILINMAKDGHAVALYSPEMSGIATARRGLSSLADVRTNAMRSGRLADGDFERLAKQFELMSGLPIYISDASGLTSLDVRVDLLRLKEKYNVEVGAIDYEGLLVDEIGRMDENDRSKIVSSRVHDIFKDLDLCGLVIHDMNKVGISGQEKGKAGLAGSSRVLFDADQIIIAKLDKDDETLVNLKWEKFREGENNRVAQLRKKEGFPAFEDIRRLP